MKRLFLLLPLLFVAVLSAAPALQPQGTAAVSAVLKGATDRGDVPGVVVAVVNKDGLIYNEAFGKSSTLGNTPMAKDTIFNMASMTKPITSVAIMILVDEGKLKLDDDVANTCRSTRTSSSSRTTTPPTPATRHARPRGPSPSASY